jgi:6-phospho-3-hexuloisomerase
MHIAKREGAKILFLTAVADAQATTLANHTLVIPAQTMATDQGSGKQSVLPMGSVYEGAMFVLFEMMTLRIRILLDVKTETMRDRHTNME